MVENKTFVVKEGGIRLDAALLSLVPTTSRAFVREAVAAGAVKIGGRTCRKGEKLRGGETVTVERLRETSDNLVAPDPSIVPVEIHSDDDILAYDKPAGLPVQPLSPSETGTLMNGVAAIHPECIPLGDRPLMAGALHRIDAGTSGLVLVARNADAYAAIRRQFSAREVRKTYLALVEGEVASGATLENDLAHDPSVPFCRMIDCRKNRLCESERRRLKPMRAVTAYRPVAQTTKECETRTLLEVEIRTGVTHQIRAQLAMAGIHIVNDRLYGAFAVEDMEGHLLHSLAARFVHPGTGREIEIRTALPEWAAFASRT